MIFLLYFHFAATCPCVCSYQYLRGLSIWTNQSHHSKTRSFIIKELKIVLCHIFIKGISYIWGVCLVIYLTWKIIKFLGSFLNSFITLKGKGGSQDQINHMGVWQSLKALLIGDTYLLSCQFYPWGKTVTEELAFGCVETVKETHKVINLNPFHFKPQQTVEIPAMDQPSRECLYLRLHWSSILTSSVTAIKR